MGADGVHFPELRSPERRLSPRRILPVEMRRLTLPLHLPSQIIARSGMTGLAGGDHLHFSLLINGVQINPIEWWDPKWVTSRITKQLQKKEPVNPKILLPNKLLPSPFPYAPPPKF